MVSAAALRLTIEQALDGHPWVSINVGQFNYIHMYTVELVSPFNNFQPGDLVEVYHCEAKVSVTLTQQMIDDTTVVARLGLSV
jgi:transcription elongation factor